jgi:hypothetical protein
MDLTIKIPSRKVKSYVSPVKPVSISSQLLLSILHLVNYSAKSTVMTVKKIIPLVCAGLAFAFIRQSAWGQQTLINVPSADVTPRGELFLQHESQFHPWNPGAYWIGTHYSALGIGFNTELDLTLFNTSAPALHNNSLGFGFKTTLPLLKKKLPKEELKLVVGEMLPISLDSKSINSWTYVLGSARIPKIGTRLSAGITRLPEQIAFKNTVCFLGAIEQPVNNRITVFTEWYSGKNGLGFLTPAISIRLPWEMGLYCGYQIHNFAENGQNCFAVEIARTFPLYKLPGFRKIFKAPPLPTEPAIEPGHADPEEPPAHTSDSNKTQLPIEPTDSLSDKNPS